MKKSKIIEFLIVTLIAFTLSTIAIKGLFSDTRTGKFKESDVVCLKGTSTKVIITSITPWDNHHRVVFSTGETYPFKEKMLEECKE